MKQCSINGVTVNYIHYGDAILIMKSIKELDIENGLIIPYNSIDNGVFELHDKQYTIKFMDN